MRIRTNLTFDGKPEQTVYVKIQEYPELCKRIGCSYKKQYCGVICQTKSTCQRQPRSQSSRSCHIRLWHHPEWKRPVLSDRHKLTSLDFPTPADIISPRALHRTDSTTMTIDRNTNNLAC